jgi:hypothetical protein
VEYKKYLDFRNEKYTKILVLIDEIGIIKILSISKQFEIDKKLREISEELRQLESVWHQPDEFRFTVSEFGDRCLRAIQGTY